LPDGFCQTNTDGVTVNTYYLFDPLHTESAWRRTSE
jgi:hypothetical protein